MVGRLDLPGTPARRRLGGKTRPRQTDPRPIADDPPVVPFASLKAGAMLRQGANAAGRRLASGPKVLQCRDFSFLGPPPSLQGSLPLPDRRQQLCVSLLRARGLVLGHRLICGNARALSSFRFHPSHPFTRPGPSPRTVAALRRRHPKRPNSATCRPFPNPAAPSRRHFPSKAPTTRRIPTAAGPLSTHAAMPDRGKAPTSRHPSSQRKATLQNLSQAGQARPAGARPVAAIAAPRQRPGRHRGRGCRRRHRSGDPGVRARLGLPR